jgi:integrase
MVEKRRHKGQGSIHQRSDGHWVAQIDLGKDENDKRIRWSRVGSYEKVSAEFDLQKGRIQMGGGQQPTQIRLSDWLDSWMISVSPKLRPTTRDGYDLAIRRIKKYMGGTRLTTVSIKHISALYSVMAKNRLSVATIKKTLTVLGMALNMAVNAHYILYNPISMFEMPKVEHKPPTVLTISGQRTFAKFCEQKAEKGSVYADVFLFILETGLRLGEIMALQWDHIILRDNRIYIHVMQTAARVSNDEDAETKTRIHIGRPKTQAGERLVPTTAKANAILNRCKARQTVKTDFVFAAKTGNMLQDRNIRRALDSFCMKLGIKHLSVHELRHTFSTRMYEAGIPSEERARIMGHADSRTTDRIYVTVGIGSITSAMEKYEKSINESKIGNEMATTMTSSLQTE